MATCFECQSNWREKYGFEQSDRCRIAELSLRLQEAVGLLQKCWNDPLGSRDDLKKFLKHFPEESQDAAR